MGIPRFYTVAPLQPDSEISLHGDIFHHGIRVLRLKVGDTVVLFDGHGQEFNATLIDIRRRDATVRLDAGREQARESPLHITLWQGISRGERMDYALQKAVELGVSVLQPVITERTQTPRQDAQLAKRQQHWQGIIIAACEQSGRNRLPELRPPRRLSDCWHLPPGSTALVLDPQASSGLRSQAAPHDGKLILLIGPEGGLSDTEIATAQGAGFQGLRFGPRILRTETATAAALSAVQTLWGDLG